MSRATDISNEFRRFALAATAGLTLDLATAWAFASYFETGLFVAATAGFAAGTALNYVVHELWTFKAGPQRLSLNRLLRYSGALTATLVVRLIVIAGLQQLVADRLWDLAILVLATAASFGANYAISRVLVFNTNGSR